MALPNPNPNYNPNLSDSEAKDKDYRYKRIEYFIVCPYWLTYVTSLIRQVT